MVTNFLDRASDINAGFSKHPITDDLKTVKNEDAISQHIDFLLNMGEDATLFKPYVCAGIRNYLFEDLTPHKKRILVNRIKLSLRYEPRITYGDIEIDFISDSNDIKIRIPMTFIETDKEFIYRTTLKRVI